MASLNEKQRKVLFYTLVVIAVLELLYAIEAQSSLGLLVAIAAGRGVLFVYSVTAPTTPAIRGPMPVPRKSVLKPSRTITSSDDGTITTCWP